MKTITFFNHKGGVGKTSLVYHLAWMYSDLGVPVLAVDLDPQANLTSMFLSDDRLETLWPDSGEHPGTVYGAVRPILRGLGDVQPPPLCQITPLLGLVPGDLGLSSFEDKLSTAWPLCHNSDEASFRVMTAFHRIIRKVAGEWARIALVDVGPNLGAINRAALISSDCVCLPLAPDLFSLQGLRNLGPALRGWRETWQTLRTKAPQNLPLPSGAIQPIGYVVMQHGMRDNRPVKAYQRWMNRIPGEYRAAVLGDPDPASLSVEGDSNCLALLKHYRSLMPLAMEARKPMFQLKPMDGAIGAHVEAVKQCRDDFRALAQGLVSAGQVLGEREGRFEATD